MKALFAFCRSLLWLTIFCLSVSSSYALDLHANHYVAYEGSNSSGQRYLFIVPTEQVLIIHGEINIPIVHLPVSTGYRLLINADGTVSGLTTLVNTTADNVATRCAEVSVSCALSSYRFFDGDFNGDGYKALLLQGAGSNPSFVLAENGAPSIAHQFATKLNSLLVTLSVGQYGGSVTDDILVTDNSGFQYMYISHGASFYLFEPEDLAYKGRLSGDFKVANNGAASYSLGIDVPAGINGMQPAIKLQANNQSGNGLMGLNWTIGGLSRIHRCHASWRRDGLPGGINYGDNYKFCIDGQRLVEIGHREYRTESEIYAKIVARGSAGAGPASWTVYKRDGTVMDYGTTADAQQKEQVRADIYTWHLNKMTDKAGNYLTVNYTRNTAAGIHRPNTIDYTKNAFAADTQFRLQFNYESRNDIITRYVAGALNNIDQRLSNIIITNNGQLVSRYNVHYAADSTVYDDTMASRITAIERCFGNQASSCQPAVSFDWTNTSGVSEPITNTSSMSGSCPGGGDDYRGFLHADFNNDGFMDCDLKVGGSAFPTSLRETLSYSNTEAAPDTAWEKYWMDLNGDGYLDKLALPTKQEPVIAGFVYEPATKTFRYTPGYTIATSELTFTAQYTNDAGTQTLDTRYITKLADFNGDGLIDVVRIATGCYIGCTTDWGKRYDISVALNTGAGFQPFVVWVTLSNSNELTQLVDAALEHKGDLTNLFDASLVHTGDVNGDRLPDLVFFDGSVAVNKGTHFDIQLHWKTDSQWWPWPSPTIFGRGIIGLGGTSTVPTTQLADVNGDGLVDLVGYTDHSQKQNPDNIYDRWEAKYTRFPGSIGVDVSLSTGTSFLPAKRVANVSCLRGSCLLVDLNRDGRADLVSASSIGGERTGEIYLAKEDGTFVSIRDVDTIYSYMLSASSLGLGREPSYDFDGDGDPDVRYFRNNFPKVAIEAIHEGTNRSIDIDYSLLSTREVYDSFGGSTGGGATWNLSKQAYNRSFGMVSGGGSGSVIHGDTSIPAPVKNYVVASAKITDKTTGTSRSKDYFYRNARIDTLGWGNLGFAEVTETEHYAPGKIRQTVSQYSHDFGSNYNLSGRLNKKITYATDASRNVLQKLTETENRWKVRVWNDDYDSGSFNSPHYFPYLHSQITSHWGLDGFAIKTHAVQNFEDGSVDCQVPAPTQKLMTYDSEYDADGNLRYQLNARCGALGGHAVATLNNMITSRKSSDQWVLGLVNNHTKSAWTLGNGDGGAVLATQSRTMASTYNAKGQVDTTTREPDDPELAVTDAYQYNAYGGLSTHVRSWASEASEGLGFTSTTTSWAESFAADGLHTVIQTNPLGQTQTTQYDGDFGSEISHTDSNDLTVTTEYNRYGQIERITRADGSTTTLGYVACGQCSGSQTIPAHRYQIDVQEEGSPPVSTFYDGLGREVYQSTFNLAGEAVATATAYDAFGRTRQNTHNITQGAMPSVTTFSYDILDRLEATLHPDGSSTTQDYDWLQVATTNGLAQKSIQFSNSADQMVISLDELGNRVDYQYTPFGDLQSTSVTPTGGSAVVTSIGYDNLGRKLSLDDPDTGLWSFKYNALGEVAKQTDANNAVTRYSYDPLGRLVERVWDANRADAASRTATWTYDTAPKGIGLLASVQGYDTQGRAFAESYGYTENSLLETQDTTINGRLYQQHFSYDSLSRLTDTVFPGGQLTTVNHYNGLGFLVGLSQRLDNGDLKTLWQAEDADGWGNITHATWGNGASVQHQYKDDSGLIHTISALRGDLTLHNQRFEFDVLGNLVSRTDNRRSLTESFCYDGLNRLVGSSFGRCGYSDYQYDGLGNLRQKGTGMTSAGYGEAGAGPHALTSATIDGAPVTYQYDNNGQMINRAGHAVTYSPFGKPLVMSGPEGSTEVIYGPDQNRIQRLEAGRTTTYVDGVFEQIEENGSTTHNYYVGDMALYRVVDGQASWHYFHRDHIGSVVATSNDAPVTALDVDWQAYDAWGAVLDGDWDGFAKEELALSERGFTGHEHLLEVGLVHMNGRVYDPLVGRFLSPDPLVEDPYNTQAYNRYSYVLNNPLSRTDPTGYSSCGSAPICVDEGAGRSDGWGSGAPSSGTMAGLASGAMHFQGGVGADVPSFNGNTSSQGSNQQLAMSEAGQVVFDTIHNDGVPGVDPKHPDTQAGYQTAAGEVVTLMVGGVAVKVVVKAGKIVKVEKLGDKLKDSLNLATKGAGNIKKFPITDKALKKQITDALAGNGQLPNLTRQQRKSLINHYKQFQKSNASTKEETAQALNWARIRFLEGKGPAPGRANNQLYDFVDAFRKSQ